MQKGTGDSLHQVLSVRPWPRYFFSPTSSWKPTTVHVIIKRRSHPLSSASRKIRKIIGRHVQMLQSRIRTQSIFFCTKWFLILDKEIASPPPKTKLFCLLSFGCPFFLFCITAFYSAICIQCCFTGKWLAYHTYNCLLNCFLEVSPSLTWGTAIHKNNFRKSIYHTLHMKDNYSSLQVFL